MPPYPAVSAAAINYSSHTTQMTPHATSSTAAPCGPSSRQPLNNEPPDQMPGNSKQRMEAKSPATVLQTAKSVSETANLIHSHLSSPMFDNQYSEQTSLLDFISHRIIATKPSLIYRTAPKSPLVLIGIPNATVSTTSIKRIKRETLSTIFSTASHRFQLPRLLQQKYHTG